MITQSSSYLMKADTKEEAVERYKGKKFVYPLSGSHSIELEVTHVEVSGGYILAYAKMTRPLTSDQQAKNHTEFRKTGEWIHPGRLGVEVEPDTLN